MYEFRIERAKVLKRKILRTDLTFFILYSINISGFLEHLTFKAFNVC